MAGDFVLSPVEGLTRAEVTSFKDSPLAPLLVRDCVVIG